MDGEKLQDLSSKKEHAHLTAEICNTSFEIRKIS